MLCARETTINFFLMYLSPLKPKPCAGHNAHTVSDNLIIFGRNIYQVKYNKFRDGYIVRAPQ